MDRRQLLTLINLATRHRWRKLDLREKSLTELPKEIGNLENLRQLDLSYNHLIKLPPEIGNLTELRHLHLNHNNLTSVPTEISRLSKLRYLDLKDNPELPISPELLQYPSDPERILDFISRLGEVSTAQRLNEAKMLVVGDGKVGKTSLVNRLLYGTFDPYQGTTLGVDIKDEIEIKEWHIKSTGDPIKLNIWDFGGQEIQHSTHQFFLTTR
jgi:internalin A